MVIFRTAASASDYLFQQRRMHAAIGFVPTMGALHHGHLSLIEAAAKENDVVVSSIFINPSQFNNKEDLVHYPVTIEKDIELLIGAGCSVLFLPSTEEIYPSHYIPLKYDLGTLEHILEGAHRPGHFQGVCQVVDRLLHIVQPQHLYIGQKDYQQCLVIKKLLNLTNRKTSVHIIDTKRESSGLAMSSRNLRLTEAQKTKAAFINKVLLYIEENLQLMSVQDITAVAAKKLMDAGFVVDYVAIADGDTLEELQKTQNNAVALVAATLDGIRLIDNRILNKTHQPAIH